MIYDPQNHHIQAGPVIHDPGVACVYLYAYDLWFLGYAEQASMRMDMALERARKMAHPYTLICAMGNQLELLQHRREPGLVQACAEAMLAYADEHGFSYWAAEGAVLNGWALAMLGQAQAGLAQLQQGLATHRDTGAVLSQPYFHGLLAEALARAGELDAALIAITEGLALAEHTQEGHYEAELHRLQGELLLRQGGMDVADTAESCFQRSLAIAHRQQAKAWELRTATSLARLWCDQDECQAAYDLLAPVYNWFTEGFDTADLKNAKALLDELICNN
jgi:predicted ATPase